MQAEDQNEELAKERCGTLFKSGYHLSYDYYLENSQFMNAVRKISQFDLQCQQFSRLPTYHHLSHQLDCFVDVLCAFVFNVFSSAGQ